MEPAGANSHTVPHFAIDYGVTAPGFITLTAIPEPGTLGLIGASLGLAALLRRRLRRRRR